MSQELSAEISPEIINSLILTGDMSKLTAAQQTQYYTAICKTLGLNPLTQPFAIIVLQGKKTLYALKGCTQQLCDTRKINTEIKKTDKEDSIYVTHCRATMPDGRFTDDIGAVGVLNLKGQDLANAYMKSVTKSKRRAVLALCGLGMPDESEIEDIKNVRNENIDTSKSRVEQIIENQVEEAQVTKEDKPNETQEEPKPKSEEPIQPKRKKANPKDTETIIPQGESINDKEKVATGVRDLSSGHKVIIGLIDNKLQGENGEVICMLKTKEPVLNPNDGTHGIKYSFLIRKDGVDARFGTWDASLAKQVMDCIDQRILVKFEYKERIKEGKTFNDIISFKQATVDEVQNG